MSKLPLAQPRLKARLRMLAASLLVACSEAGEAPPAPDATLDADAPVHDADASSADAAPSEDVAGDGAASSARDAAVQEDAKPDRDARNDAAAADAQVDSGPLVQGRSGPSAGCGHAPPAADSSAWVKHDIMVGDIAARFRMGGAKYGTQHGYDFEHRNYFLRLPAGYDRSKPYALVISAAGCGATDGLSGKGGGSNPLADNQSVAVQVGLSYVYPNGAGACFADETADTPDLPYFDAVLAELDKAYCFDRGKVFVSGFSSGAWLTYMLGCARGGVVRGIGTQAGGLRKERPPCSDIPVAALLTAGVNDANPIQNLDKTGFDTGSQAARDVILKTNGCATRDTAPYLSAEAPADWHCLRYTSCPAAYPVVWCAITADGGGHGAGSNKAFWPFWSVLP